MRESDHHSHIMYPPDSISEHWNRVPQPRSGIRIRSVWSHNLAEEMAIIEDLVKDYNTIAIEVRSVGLLIRPTSLVDSYLDLNYLTLKLNIDMGKVSQIELTFADAKNHLPAGVLTWQFNFMFNETEDLYLHETMMELQNCGVSLTWLKNQGIDPVIFGELLTSSGLVLNDQIQWVSVVGCSQRFHEPVKVIGKESLPQDAMIPQIPNPLLVYSGLYDFAFLLSMLTGQPLPVSISEFTDQIMTYFPKVCLRRPSGSDEALNIKKFLGSRMTNLSNRRHPIQRIHCLRCNVHEPSLFAIAALNEFYHNPDDISWRYLIDSIRD